MTDPNDYVRLDAVPLDRAPDSPFMAAIEDAIHEHEPDAEALMWAAETIFVARGSPMSIWVDRDQEQGEEDFEMFIEQLAAFPDVSEDVDAFCASIREAVEEQEPRELEFDIDEEDLPEER